MAKNRKSFLQELLIGVYKTDRLNFDDVEVSIKGRSIFDNCDLSNNKSRGHSYERYEQLFNATFNDSPITWCLDTYGNSYNPTKAADKIINQTQFSVSAAIDNSFAYLKSIGVNFDIYCKNKPIEIEGISDTLNKIMHDIIYLVFFWRVDGKPISAKDDISSLLSYQISSVNSWLIRKSYEINGYTTASSYNSVVESGRDKSSCNRFIYVTIKDLSIQNNVSIYVSQIKSYIVNKKETKNLEFKMHSLGYNFLMSDLGIFSPYDNKVYRLTSLPATIDSSSNSIYDIVSYPDEKFLSNIHPNPNSINEFGIYYLFNLDENRIKTFYPDVNTPHDLRSAIIRKANRELLNAFKKRIFSYINDVLLYIEDVISCIMSFEPEKLINGVIDEKTLSVFNIDYDSMLSFYKENNVIEEANLYLYMMIDRALYDFSNQLKCNYYYLSCSVLDYIEHERIKTHLEKLNIFITSDMIKKAIAVQAKDEKENPSAYRLGINEVSGGELCLEAYKKKTPGLFQSLFDNVNNYHILLKSDLKE